METTKKVSFLFGIHNHQPIGNFHEVFESAYQKSYAPFADVLASHPKIHWSLHCTGILWEWLEKNHPDYLNKISSMVQRGQLELVSGAYYEAILPVIPDYDKIGQIEKQNRYLKERFGVEAKGLWCTERVWEPHLPRPMRQAGIEYTILDDTHFLAAGLPQEQLKGYYKVQEQGEAVDIFPISQELRYSMPFAEPEKTIEILRKASLDFNSKEIPALVMADDGEKFGFWPETYKAVYEERWLDRFLSLLEENESWISPQTFSEYRQTSRALGSVYLPTGSYLEMSEWSLPTESRIEFEDIMDRTEDARVLKFLKGGIWRNFLVKYPESNTMYQKMLRLSRRIHEKASAAKKSKRIFPVIEAARNHLWAAQCNCAYWHGVFGGLYMPILRQAIYRKLIDAENALDAADAAKSKKSAFADILKSDYDHDGSEEILMETKTQNLYFSPALGGSLFEWDYKGASVNLGNVLSRRPEAYHSKLTSSAGSIEDTEVSASAKSIHHIVAVKEKGLETLLHYDWYRKASLIDHFFHPHTTPETFLRSQYGEQGDFVLSPYQFEDAGSKKKTAVKLSRKGIVWLGDQKREILIEKVVEFDPANNQSAAAAVDVTYALTDQSLQEAEDLWFGVEFNFAFSVPDAVQDQPFKAKSSWERTDIHQFFKLKIDFTRLMDGWVFPLETVSNSESGFEKTFQGLTFVPHARFSLDPNQRTSWTFRFNLERNS